MEGYRRFLALLVSALLLGFVAVVCSIVWVLRYREGLGWDGGAAEFNWHPVLVVTGFVFVQGIGAWGLRGRGAAGGERRGGKARQGKARERKAREGKAALAPRRDKGSFVVRRSCDVYFCCFLFLSFFFLLPFEHLFTLAWIWECFAQCS